MGTPRSWCKRRKGGGKQSFKEDKGLVPNFSDGEEGKDGQARLGIREMLKEKTSLKGNGTFRPDLPPRGCLQPHTHEAAFY